VVQYKNYKEIPEYINLSKKLKVDNMGLQKLSRWSHMDILWWNENKIDNNPNVDYKFLKNVLTNLESDPTVGVDGGLKNLHPFQIK
jgi:hypothetical protein